METVKVKAKDLGPLLAVNREVLGSNEIKAAVGNALAISISAQKNIRILEKALIPCVEDENDIRKIAARKDASGKPVLIDNGRGGKKYDIPEDAQEEFNKAIEKLHESEIDVPVLIRFSENVAEKALLFIKNDQSYSAALKCDLFLQYLVDLKQETKKTETKEA